MSKKRLGKKLGVVVALSLLLGLGNVPNVSSAKALENDKSFEMLKDWYEDYKVNGNEVVVGNEAVTGDESGDQKATNYLYYNLGRSVYYVESRTKTQVITKSVSIGYRARYRRKDGSYYFGFVTCAHGTRDAVDAYIYATDYAAKNNGQPIGRRYFSVYNGKIDAAFVWVNSSSTISAKTCGKDVISAKIKTVSKGDKVCMCGGVSGTMRGLEVIDTNKCGVMIKDRGRGEREFNNLIEIKCQGLPGDSGAVVYCQESGNKRIVGIYVAQDDYYPLGFVVPAQEINKVLGLTTY